MSNYGHDAGKCVVCQKRMRWSHSEAMRRDAAGERYKEWLECAAKAGPSLQRAVDVMNGTLATRP